METVVNFAEHWACWRASDDGELGQFTFESLFERRPAWCFDFCHRFAQIGKRLYLLSPLTISRLCDSALSLSPPPSPLRPARL